MAFISLTESLTKAGRHAGRRGGGHPKRADDTLLLGICRSGKKEDDRFSLLFTLYPDVYKRARFQHHDRMDVLFDNESGLCLIRRNNKGLWSLYHKTAGGKVARRSASPPLNMQMTIQPEMPYFRYRQNLPSVAVEWDIENEEGGILLQLPRHPAAKPSDKGW